MCIPQVPETETPPFQQTDLCGFSSEIHDREDWLIVERVELGEKTRSVKGIELGPTP